MPRSVIMSDRKETVKQQVNPSTSSSGTVHLRQGADAQFVIVLHGDCGACFAALSRGKDAFSSMQQTPSTTSTAAPCAR
jgi:Fe-S cluster biogenesis protein NfuA